MQDDLVACRSFLAAQLQKEFVGPGSEGSDGGDPETERISENPLNRYALGILYPRLARVEDDLAHDEPEIEVNEPQDYYSPSTDSSSIGDDRRSSKQSDSENIDVDSAVSEANQFCPSSYGITFFVSNINSELHVTVTGAKYERLELAEAYVELTDNEKANLEEHLDECFEIQDRKYYYRSSTSIGSLRSRVGSFSLQLSRIHDKARNFSMRGYRRIPVLLFDGVVKLDSAVECLPSLLPNEIELRLRRRIAPGEPHKITLTVLNKNVASPAARKHSEPEKCFFQNKIIVRSLKASRFEEIPGLAISVTSDPEDKLLFRGRRVFACGHGCSANWNDTISPNVIESTFTPISEVPRIETSPNRVSQLGLRIFDMQYLAYASSRSEVLSQIQTFIEDYDRWISETRTESDTFQEVLKETARASINKCEEAVIRLKEALEILSGDDRSWTAFQLTNLSMSMQRYHTDNFVRKPRSLGDAPPCFVDRYDTIERLNAKWRPFQLAFLLLNIEPTVNDQSSLRSTADLIWFPTGGGKTEAYLGVIAFAIFYRRLRYGAGGSGVSAIMRYTLRLLTAQQFERASTLIVACEYIRRTNPSFCLGDDPITIGLWVGLDNTPNSQKQAAFEIQRMIERPEEFEDESPFQVILCPWCGTKLLNKKQPAKSGYVSHPSFHFKCVEPTCCFNDRLPLQVVDEHIYGNPPTLLFATVDKFAQLAWNSETRSLFGLEKMADGHITRKRRPPDLIIQDELHLIAGPLGSLFGLYELIIDYLCSHGGSIPRIICSTATVKRASDQIRLLFNRDTNVFPPNGMSISDNYFSHEIPLTQSPGRLYMGLMSIGISRATCQTKAFSCLLFGRDRIPENLRDAFYTLVCYFNTIRELGRASSLFDADILEKIQSLQARYRVILAKGFWSYWKKELTSRAFTKELPKTLKQLQDERFPSPNAIPAVLTTNMFSVGVDISRLNLMTMVGQPKSTSEYIQSTSRVGRSDPGLILTILDGFCMRDRSHFENFKAYHESFYRFVEPSGSTPYSEPSRRRVLHSLVIIAVKLLSGLDQNSDADRFTKDLFPNDLFEHIRRRIEAVDKEELNDSLSALDSIIEAWEGMTNNQLKFAVPYQPYGRRVREDINVLMRTAGTVPEGANQDAWPVLTAMRTVDSPCECVVED